MSLDINDEKLTALIHEIEKVRRRKIVNINEGVNIQYLDPYDNLGKVKIPNNHLILGRRGSGKTTLLVSAINADSDNFMLPIDCQLYRDYDSNKIILELLLEISVTLKFFIHNSKEYKESKIEYAKEVEGTLNWIKNIFNSTDKIYDYEKFTFLLSLIENFNTYLQELNILPNENIKINVKQENKNNKKTIIQTKEEQKIVGKIKASGSYSTQFTKLESNIDLLASNSYQKTDEEVSESVKENRYEYEKIINKKDKIHELVLVFSEIISDFTHLSKRRAVLYLDDFYLIKLTNQPNVIQFFHDVYKRSKHDAFCFKICSIPNRTRLNNESKVDFSIKDDFSPIRLDKELDDFHNLKDFLLRITSNLAPELEIASIDILNLFNNEDVINYAIVAAGGVPRDFLVNLAELIKIARTDSSSTIKREHLYSVVSDLKQDKDQNIEIECDISFEKLRQSLEIIKNEVIDNLKTNIILYPISLTKDHEALLKNLVNLRYLHIINENTSSKKRKEEQFTSYLVDMTFYATARRLPRGFEFRSLWETETTNRPEQIRNAPIWSFDNDFAINT